MFASLGLHERLLKALDKLELTTPTPVQEQLIPVALAGRDVQVSAETGSGKTAAYLLPILHQMLATPAPKSATRALVLLPTRELAHQVDKHCRELAGFTNIKTGLILGGHSFNEQKALIRKNPEFIIGSPGRILEHVQQHSIELKDLEFLVLDEADRMLDMGFRDAVLEIVRACRKQRQTLLLSATLVHTGIGKIAGEVLQDPAIVEIGTHRSAHQSIEQQRILADDPSHKNQLTNWLLANTVFDKALIFTNTREHAQELAAFLTSQRDRDHGSDNTAWGRAAKQSMKIGCLHGELDQLERKRIMGLYRQGGIRVLVATDIAARGLDVKGVNLVINYGIPRSGDDYVHRIGRTGRAGETGLAIALVSPPEWNTYCSIERYLGVTMTPREVEKMKANFKGLVKKIGGKAKGKDSKKDNKKDNKKKDEANGKQKKIVPKAKQRHRYTKNIGKRRQPSAKAAAAAAPLIDSGGLAPLKRKSSR
ncbi:MAG TPA: DEAD/DEAH box helicase [Candidatus Acidoferrum sp.]|nr:DEAD/DEAH box helicase [Candidatus Acidoferrum sp.]